MSYHGGLIGIVVVFSLMAWRYHYNFWRLTDFVVPVVPLGYFFGRIGNFLGGELYGRATTVPWGMTFFDGILRHPVQLYEAMCGGLLVFAVLWGVRNRHYVPGQLTILFIVLAGTTRFLTDFFREPDAHIGFIWNFFTVGQLLSLAMACSACMLYWGTVQRTAVGGGEKSA